MLEFGRGALAIKPFFWGRIEGCPKGLLAVGSLFLGAIARLSVELGSGDREIV
ncbi:hypothetical protein [Oscillatoria sp. FACHB-1406]|uniref:hypothetical protein n=1 Tax=Oscillatoria sp. FACHB-1406 TaxID=2692846 RepID=UPI0016841516|nr:hypothetical protein [Oscillatoria sp. FACHB-1406]MBD2579407.1 hypothetical protein [Oscillatoria sp. FACHB-1406]